MEKTAQLELEIDKLQTKADKLVATLERANILLDDIISKLPPPVIDEGEVSKSDIEELYKSFSKGILAYPLSVSLER